MPEYNSPRWESAKAAKDAGAAWSARCDCYSGHASASGRCTARDVTDPTQAPGSKAVRCTDCRETCLLA